MYLSGIILGSSNFNGYPPSITIIPSYNKITVFGQQTINYIKVYNRVLQINELDSVTLSTIPEWDINTVALATFNNSIDAGTISNLSDPITQVNIQRLDSNESVATNLGTVPVNSSTFYNNLIPYFEDLTVATNRNYIYYVTPMTATTSGSILTSDPIDVDFYNWSLTDSVTGDVFIFDLDIKSGELDQQTDHTEYPTFNSYNKMQFGERSFIKGSLTCTAGSITDLGGYTCTADFIDNLKSVISNSNLKYIKSRKGDFWVCVSYDFKCQYTDESSLQPAQITFSFQEVENINQPILQTSNNVSITVSGNSQWGYF